jgi:hypothetical protein
MQHAKRKRATCGGALGSRRDRQGPPAPLPRHAPPLTQPVRPRYLFPVGAYTAAQTRVILISNFWIAAILPKGGSNFFYDFPGDGLTNSLTSCRAGIYLLEIARAIVAACLSRSHSRTPRAMHLAKRSALEHVGGLCIAAVHHLIKRAGACTHKISDSDLSNVRFSNRPSGSSTSGYPPRQCRCRSRARDSLRTRHQGPSSWVISGKAHSEQMLSALLPEADIDRRGGHVRLVPGGDMR